METANVFSSSSFFHLSRGSGGGCVHTYTMEGGGGEGGLLRPSIAAIVGKKEGGRADLGYGRNGKGRGRERERGQGFLFPSPSITTKKSISHSSTVRTRERERVLFVRSMLVLTSHAMGEGGLENRRIIPLLSSLEAKKYSLGINSTAPPSSPPPSFRGIGRPHAQAGSPHHASLSSPPLHTSDPYTASKERRSSTTPLYSSPSSSLPSPDCMRKEALAPNECACFGVLLTRGSRRNMHTITQSPFHATRERIARFNATTRGLKGKALILLFPMQMRFKITLLIKRGESV